MADLLAGTAGHASHAPLSGSQSIAIGQHLSEQIRQLQAVCDELGRAQSQGHQGATGLAAELAQTNRAAQNLQEQVNGLGAEHQATRAELDRTAGALQRCQGATDDNRAGLGALREAHATSDVELRRVNKEAEQAKALAHDVREEMEKRISHDIQALKKDLAVQVHDLASTKAEVERHGQCLHEHKQGLRDAKAVAQSLRDDLLKVDCRTGTLEQKMEAAAAEAHSARQALTDLESASQRSTEESDRTNAGLSTVQATTKKLASLVKHLTDDHDQTSKSMELAKAKLDDACEVLDSTRQLGERVKGQVRSLEEGHNRKGGQLQDLEQELREVAQLARETKVGLQATNAMVLPNLTSSADLACSTGNVMGIIPGFVNTLDHNERPLSGSKTARGRASPTCSQSTPNTPCKSSKTSHIKKMFNGTSENRFAWI